MEALMTVLAPKHLFMLLCAAMPIQMLYYWLLQRAIPPKSKKAYWVVGVSLSLAVDALRPIMPEVLRGSFGMVLSVLVPIFLLGGPLVRRISVCCIGMICMALGELSGGLFWIAVTGLEVMSPDYAFANAGAYAASGIVGYGMVMTPCMLGLAKFCRRFFPDAVTTAASRKGSGRTQNVQDVRAAERAGKQASGQVGARGAQAAVEVGMQAAAEIGMQASDRPSEGGTRSLWLQRIALLPLVQLPFVFLLLLISYNLLRGETHYVVWSAGLLFACVIVDLLLFVQISRSMESRRTEIEAALLEERLAGYLRELTAVQELLGDTARLRHDLRNHQAVVATLCERGDRAAALDYLEDVANSL